MKKNEQITYDISTGWPCGISDGLVLACADCGEHTRFDYIVTDELWNAVVPDIMQRDVVCLPCLDARAKNQGMSVGQHLKEVQYTGIGETVVLKPNIIFIYGELNQEQS